MQPEEKEKIIIKEEGHRKRKVGRIRRINLLEKKINPMMAIKWFFIIIL